MRSFLLFPFAFLFRIAVFLRNKLYDYGILNMSRLNAKVVSVGNITTGGTGKTPMAEFIADYFLRKNKVVAIVTKGYKRTYDDIQVAELGYKNESKSITSEKFGDEGLVLLETFQNLEPGKGIIVVSDDKKSGARLADNKFKADVIIIDDGFQHRKLFRDLDIALVSFNFKRRLLPAGDLREPFHNLHRADIIIQNHKFDKEILKHIKGIPGSALDCTYELESFRNDSGQILESKNLKATAFCGIADPDSFKNLLEMKGIEINSISEFSDHHNFTPGDIHKIVMLYEKNKSNCILTTHKDFVRIKYSASLAKAAQNLLLNYPLYYAKIKLQIPKNSNILTDSLDKLFEGP
jgi:tetraacyldisaccharide 4'-kinase